MGPAFDDQNSSLSWFHYDDDVVINFDNDKAVEVHCAQFNAKQFTFSSLMS